MATTHFLTQLRLQLGLSQNDLALRLKHRGVNLSRQRISYWERGLREPQLTDTDLIALADALHWSRAELHSAMEDS